MSNVTMRYFIAEGERAEKVAAEGLAQVNAVRTKRRELLNELGAELFWATNRRPIGVIFQGAGEAKPGFLPPAVERDGDKELWVYKPDQRTKIGKAAMRKMNAAQEFDFSGYVVQHFGVDRMVFGSSSQSRTGMALYESVAGFVDKKLVFKIPFGGDRGDGRPGDIEIPADLREIKKSEFIAITEEAS